MLSERGRVSGSFLLAIAAVVALVGGYTAYSLLFPNPYELSERVVRDSRRQLSAQVRDFQREVDALLRETKRRGKDANDAIDRQVETAMRGIDHVIVDARDRLADLDVELRTQRNRMDRITGRAQEAREVIEEHANEAKTKAAAAQEK